jgi:nitrite reductase/ring-hydroxylating ferredoxin subunit
VTDNEFRKVAELSELFESKGIVRKLDDDEIALVKLDGGVSAFLNVCPNQRTPLVDGHGGRIAGNNLICPMHGWMVDLGTANCINVPPCRGCRATRGHIRHTTNTATNGKTGKLKMLEVRVDGESVLVRKIMRDFEW